MGRIVAFGPDNVRRRPEAEQWWYCSSWIELLATALRDAIFEWIMVMAERSEPDIKLMYSQPSRYGRTSRA